MIKTFKILNVILFLLMIGVNSLANILPIGHGDTGVISGKYPNLFTPAPITFSIWGLIYILLAIFSLYQAGTFDSRQFAWRMIELIGPWFVISCIMNVGWIFSWHYEVIWLSTIFMCGLLFSLIMITVKLTPTALTEATEEGIPLLAKISIWAFDIYLGWITAASIANVSVLLVKLEWNRFGLSEQFWTVVVLLIGAILGILFILTRRKYLSAAAIIWAYCGILIKHISQSGYVGQYPLIIAVTIVCIVLILTAGVLKLILRRDVGIE